MRRLWINADDFGLSAGVSDGILRAMQQGVVHTTTAMMCAGGSREQVASRSGLIAERIGLHLQLTDGVAFGGVESGLTDSAGQFPRGSKSLGVVPAEAVLREWRLQLAAMRALGLEPSHLDTHHDVHWRPGPLEAYIALAGEARLPCRSGPPWLTRWLRSSALVCPGVTHTFGDHTDISIEGLIREAQLGAAECSDDDTIEISCHPGYVDDALRERSVYTGKRETELEVLCDPRLPAQLQSAGFDLVALPQVVDRLANH